MSVLACPRGLGAVWLFGWFCHADGLALPVRLAAGRRQGGLRAVVLCGGGAIVVGAFMPRHSGSSSHSTLIPAHQPVIQAPLYYYFFFPLHRPWTRTHREVDLRTDIWLSGCASGRGEAGAETGVAASLCLFSVLSGSNLSYQQRSFSDRFFSFFLFCV